MASACSRGAAYKEPCRAFFRGHCRWGTDCRFSHEKKFHSICRHFQNGFCVYGDQCSFLHLQCPHSDSSHHLASRRVSEPCIVSCVPNAQAGRRDSESLVTPLQSGAFENQSVPVRLTKENWALAAEFVPRKAAFVRSVSSPILIDKSKETECWDEIQHRASLKVLHSNMDSSFQYEHSKDVVCGICMDKVYDKQHAAERVFGILPNCNHAYCVGCIKRWRKTRDFQNEIIKGCPQCRVKSSYFIPHKYWIGDSDKKLQLIEDFKAKTGKIRCRFFLRGNGNCPFKSECIYLHALPHGHQRRNADQRRASASALAQQITYFSMFYLLVAPKRHGYRYLGVIRPLADPELSDLMNQSAYKWQMLTICHRPLNIKSYSQLVGIYEEDFSEEEDLDLLHCALALALIEDQLQGNPSQAQSEVLFGML